MSSTELDPKQRARLLEVAEWAIREALDTGRCPVTDPLAFPEPLRRRRASFVTLQRSGELRGCVGSLEARRPMVGDVAENACSAAFRDPRFPPVSPEELPDLSIHISLLSVPEPMVFDSETDLIAQLHPGEDGLIFEEKGRRGTFLPVVWESLPDPRDFLAHLKLKAGLSPRYWSDTIRVERYHTESFGGPPLGNPKSRSGTGSAT